MEGIIIMLSTKKTAPYGRYHNFQGGRSAESGAVPIKKKVLLKNKNLQTSKKLRKIKEEKIEIP